MSAAIPLPSDALAGDGPNDIPPSIAPDEPPRRKRGRPPGSKTGSGQPRKPQWSRATAVETYLNEIVSLAGTALLFVNREDSRIIIEGGPRIVHELVELAKTEPALRRYLELSATPGKYGPLVVALAGVIIPIAVNHGLIPTIGMFAPPAEGGGE